MKQQFSTKWVSSAQPRKQRKYRANAPLHIRSKFLHASLATDLREKHKKRALRVRTGDEVKIMRGQYAGRMGKVERVDLKRSKIYVTGIDQPKLDGTRRLYPLQPSNLMILKIADDKRRIEAAGKQKKKQKVAIAKSAPAKKETTAKQTSVNKNDTKPNKQTKPAASAKSDAKVNK